MSATYESLSPNGFSAMITRIFTKLKSLLDTKTSAEELTSGEYTILPIADKEDPSVIHFINDTTSSVIDTPAEPTSFYNKNEGSMSITVSNDKLVYTWVGGQSIGASSFYPTVISPDVTKIKYKITTGNSYSTSTQRFKIAIGVKLTYNTTTWPTAEDNDWVAVAIENTRNATLEGEIDLSDVTTNTYLELGAHGWTVTFDELIIEKGTEPTGYTAIEYKDITYGKSYTAGNHITISGATNEISSDQAEEMTYEDYEQLTTAEKEDGTIRFLTEVEGENYFYYDDSTKTLWFLDGTVTYDDNTKTIWL